MKSKPMSNAEVQKFSSERLAEMKEAGIQFVEILGCNHPPDECDSLRTMLGQKIDIEFARPLPLPGCDKEFCKCIWLAKE